ncbi:MAG: hypothetical protein INR71_07440 [Terriglobus roseus]|nr:hypothetical protein [Terriglobus roseus]
MFRPPISRCADVNGRRGGGCLQVLMLLLLLLLLLSARGLWQRAGCREGALPRSLNQFRRV